MHSRWETGRPPIPDPEKSQKKEILCFGMLSDARVLWSLIEAVFGGLHRINHEFGDIGNISPAGFKFKSLVVINCAASVLLTLPKTVTTFPATNASRVC
jgi:hypothetical protein